jgi:hypothetical protein
MVEEKKDFNESDLEDALIEFANQIERINSRKKWNTPISTPPEKVKSTIKITEIPFDTVSVSRIKTKIMAIPVISKLTRLMGRDLFLSEEPITDIESSRKNIEQPIDDNKEISVIDDDPEIDYSKFTLEDLFEDEIPNSTNALISTINSPQTNLVITGDYVCSTPLTDAIHKNNETVQREFSKTSTLEKTDR